MPDQPNFLHVPSEAEIDAMREQHHQAVDAWLHASEIVALQLNHRDTLDLDALTPDERSVLDEMLDEARKLMNARKEQVRELSSRILNAVTLRSQFLRGELN